MRSVTGVVTLLAIGLIGASRKPDVGCD